MVENRVPEDEYVPADWLVLSLCARRLGSCVLNGPAIEKPKASMGKRSQDGVSSCRISGSSRVWFSKKQRYRYVFYYY